MERPGQWPRSGGLRRRRDPALEPPWAAPVGHGYGMPLLDPDTTHLNKRPANARAGLNLRPSPTSLVAQRSRAAARSAVYEGGSLPGLMAVRVFAGHVVFL